MGRAPITCFIMQIDIRTSENNAAFCTARLQIANETALPDKSLKPALAAAADSSRGELWGGVGKGLSALKVLIAPSLCVYRSPEREDFCFLTPRGYFPKAAVRFALSASRFRFVEWGAEEAGSRRALDTDVSRPRATPAPGARLVSASHPTSSIRLPPPLMGSQLRKGFLAPARACPIALGTRGAPHDRGPGAIWAQAEPCGLPPGGHPSRRVELGSRTGLLLRGRGRGAPKTRTLCSPACLSLWLSAAGLARQPAQWLIFPSPGTGAVFGTASRGSSLQMPGVEW